ncbi:MAG: hypothetical protein MJK04_16820, partial [Psychrosphaera sp.]|nr:hypothetical protein [Psychrosphaera sp.]
MNRTEIEKNLGPLTSKLLNGKGYISMIDVFVGLGYLNAKDVESWRMKRIPYLEKCMSVNLSKVSFIVKTVRQNCINGKLKPSFTGYKSWGKGAKVNLKFSKSGQPNIEQ